MRLLLLTVMLSFAGVVCAQEPYPSKSVRLIAAAAPGGMWRQ